MTEYLIFQILLYGIMSGVLAYEIVYSDLAHWFLKLFKLDKPYPQTILLSSPKVYYKLIGKWVTFPPATIICAILCILSGLHVFIGKMVSCPYCTSFWIGLIVAYTVGLPYHLIITLPFLSMMITGVYNRLRG